MSNDIVVLNVSQISAPTPNTLQKKGAFVSVGGTTAATGSLTLYTTLAALTAAISATGNHAEVLAMATTYFAQPAAPAVSVLELGTGTADAGVAALDAWLTANPKTQYSFLLPFAWDNNANLLTLLGTFDAPDDQTYFFIRTTLGNFASYANHKCAFTLVEASTAPSTEFTAAAPFAVTLGYNPSSTSLVTPLAFSYLFGVTPYDGTAANMATLKAGDCNFVGTGAEGGISNTILYWGHLMDGRQFNYWYAADWEQINLDLNVANEVIQGSNNAVSPLYYNQNGIQRLQNRCVQVTGNAVSYGMANGQVVATRLPTDQFMANFRAGQYAGQNVVNADPFASYTAANPSDYAEGTYGGLTIIFIPQLGFEQIVINLVITDIVS